MSGNIFFIIIIFSLHSFWHISRVVTREPEAAALKVLLRIGGGRAREKKSDLSDDIVAISGQ